MQVAEFGRLPSPVEAALQLLGTHSEDDDALLNVYKSTERWLFETLGAFDRRYVMRQILPVVGIALAAGQPANIVPTKTWTVLRLSHLTGRQGAMHLLDIAAAAGSGTERRGLTEALMAQIVRTASVGWLVANIAVYAKAGLGTLRARRTQVGWELTASLSIDTPGYIAAIGAFFEQDRTADEPSAALRWLHGITHDDPANWTHIDAAYLAENGHSLRDYVAALRMLAAKPSQPGKAGKPRSVSVPSMASQLEAYLGTGSERAYSVLRRLRFDADRDQVEPFKQRERVSRLTLQPLLPDGPNALWVLPQLATNATFIVGSYLDRSLTPWPEPQGQVPESDKLIKRNETERNTEFERMVASRLRELGFAAHHNVKKLEGVQIAGDVDVLAARYTPAGGEIIIVEAKDPIQAYSPSQVLSQLTNFTAWMAKHDRRVLAIDSPAGVAAVQARLGVPLAGPKVIDRVVTRMPAVAHFHPKTRRRVTGLEAFLTEMTP